MLPAQEVPALMIALVQRISSLQPIKSSNNVATNVYLALLCAYIFRRSTQNDRGRHGKESCIEEEHPWKKKRR